MGSHSLKLGDGYSKVQCDRAGGGQTRGCGRCKRKRDQQSPTVSAHCATNRGEAYPGRYCSAPSYRQSIRRCSRILYASIFRLRASNGDVPRVDDQARIGISGNRPATCTLGHIHYGEENVAHVHKSACVAYGEKGGSYHDGDYRDGEEHPENDLDG